MTASSINITVKNFITTFLLFLFATLSSQFFIRLTDNNSSASIIYFLSVFLVSRLTAGYFWGILTSVSAIISVNYFFTFPYNKLDFSLSGYPVTFICMLAVSIITSTMTAHIKQQAKLAYEREERTRLLNQMLNEINTKLLSTNGLTYIIDLTLDYISQFTDSSAIFYLKSPQSGDKGMLRSRSPSHDKIMNSRHEKFIAHWVFENRKPAGVGTDFCGESSCIYLPLIAHDAIWGVIGIYCVNQKPIEENDIICLNLMVSHVAISIERQHLSDSQQLILIETEKEKMRANLLRAVSHDLRTPLTGMIGASETLMKNKQYLSEEEKDKMISYIYEDSNWLLHMVENLLTVTRIRAGSSAVNKTTEPLEEVVAEVIMRIKKRYPKAQIEVKVPDEFIMVPMDATLIEQVIINLVENALKHSESISPVELTAIKDEKYIEFHIADRGIGIREDRMEAIFDGYPHTGNQSSDAMKGIGIGLSICKTIIKAHGGAMSVRNRDGGGAVFTFTLPLKEDRTKAL